MDAALRGFDTATTSSARAQNKNTAMARQRLCFAPSRLGRRMFLLSGTILFRCRSAKASRRLGKTDAAEIVG